MSKISDAILETLLDEIVDYSQLDLSGNEMGELQARCDAWEDKESIESEINEYIQTIGYSPNNDCQWLLPTVFKITKANFLSWYYDSGCDSEKYDLLQDLGRKALEQLESVGKVEIIVKDIFDNCIQSSIKLSYIENLCNNPRLAEVTVDEYLENGEEFYFNLID